MTVQGIVLVATSVTGIVAFFFAGLAGVRNRALAIAALTTVAAVWAVSAIGWSGRGFDDQAWPHWTWAYFFAWYAVALLLAWIIAMVIGRLVRGGAQRVRSGKGTPTSS